MARETMLDGDGQETIRCYTCGAWKFTNEFYPQSKKRGGFSTKCSACELASRKQKYDDLTVEEKQAYARKQTGYQQQRDKTPDAIERQRELSAKYSKDEAGGWIKHCAVCRNWMPITFFYDDSKKPGGCSIWCKACVGQKKLIQTQNRTPEQIGADRKQKALYHKTRWANDPVYKARLLADGRARRKAMSPEDRKAERRQRHLRQKYKITPRDFQRLFIAAKGRCEICRKKLRPIHRLDLEQEGTNPCIDHCHECTAIRGLLCHRCNSGLGQFRDLASRILDTREYLRRSAEGPKA